LNTYLNFFLKLKKLKKFALHFDTIDGRLFQLSSDWKYRRLFVKYHLFYTHHTHTHARTQTLSLSLSPYLYHTNTLIHTQTSLTHTLFFHVSHSHKHTHSHTNKQVALFLNFGSINFFGGREEVYFTFWINGVFEL